MKKQNKITLLILLLAATTIFAQQPGDRKKMSEKEKTIIVEKMPVNQKMSLLQNFTEDLMVEELAIPESKQAAFSALYTEYQKSQKNIKGSFQKRQDFEKMNDEEAQSELDASFEIGQKLLDNKKDFSKKLQTVMKPQQVLQLFENEGKMRTKVRERSREMQDRKTTPEFKESTNETRGRSSENINRRAPSGRR